MFLAALLALITMSAVMAAGWAFQRARANGGWTDVFWTFGVGATAAALALASGPPTPRQTLIAALVGAWSVRLGLHILMRVRGAPEDARYAEFRADWGANFQARMFAFLQAQALAGATLAFAVYVAAHNPAPLGQPLDYLGVALILLAITGESMADQQLRRFKADPAHRGGIMDQGLWNWSRHPNYFFEWLVWLALPLFAIRSDNPAGWWALLAPAQMYYLLNHVSGVPPLEASMRRSRGAAFDAYAARTSRFFPRPPRVSG